jgi:hypothetical protein
MQLLAEFKLKLNLNSHLMSRRKAMVVLFVP